MCELCKAFVRQWPADTVFSGGDLSFTPLANSERSATCPRALAPPLGFYGCDCCVRGKSLGLTSGHEGFLLTFSRRSPVLGFIFRPKVCLGLFSVCDVRSMSVLCLCVGVQCVEKPSLPQCCFSTFSSVVDMEAHFWAFLPLSLCCCAPSSFAAENRCQLALLALSCLAFLDPSCFHVNCTSVIFYTVSCLDLDWDGVDWGESASSWFRGWHLGLSIRLLPSGCLCRC